MNDIKAVKDEPLLEAESDSQGTKQCPSVVLYSTVCSLISADTKTDGGVASLVPILVSNHQLISTIILSEFSIICLLYYVDISGSFSHFFAFSIL